MTRHARSIACAALLLVATAATTFGLSGTPSLSGHKGSAGNTKNELLETNIAEFELRNETVLDGLWRLARIPVPFGFGFEGVLKSTSAAPDVQEPRFSLQLRNKSGREVLNALCEADPRYTWSIDGPTVNVFPKHVLGDSSYLLNRRLDRFELRKATDVDDGLLAISRQLPLPTEQVAHVQTSGDDPYPPKPWTVIYHHLTVREVVNRLAEHGGPCAAWTFGGSKDFRYFAFFNNRRCSTQPPAWVQRIVESRPKDPQR